MGFIIGRSFLAAFMPRSAILNYSILVMLRISVKMCNRRDYNFICFENVKKCVRKSLK
jgi:hypothetical protein